MRKKLIVAVLIFGFGWVSSLTWSLISHEQAIERRRNSANFVIKRLHQKLSNYGTAFDNVGLAYSVMGGLLHPAKVVVISGTVSSTNHMNILMHHVLESRFPAQTSFSVFVDSNPQVQPKRPLDEMFPVR